MAAGIPFMKVTGRKDVQNAGLSTLKMITGFGLPYKMRVLTFRSPLTLPCYVESAKL